MKKIVIASDSFKGSLSSAEVAAAAASVLRELFPEAELVTVEVADGGEGTAEAVIRALNGKRVAVMVSDPLGRRIPASYGVAGDMAIIEMAAASGLTLLAPEERNPLWTSTYGTGELIRDALRRGCRRFFVGIGGSATHDGGMGMLTALGARFLDGNGALLPGRGCDLERVAAMDLSGMDPVLHDVSFLIACDVDTVFSGPDGAAAVFAPQKGASPEEVASLDKGMLHFASLIRDRFGGDLNAIPGSGAAGGLGGAFQAFLGARLERGSEMVLQAVGFDRLIEGADLVITGEGQADAQTARGKTAAGVLRHARAAGVPVVLLAGRVKASVELEQMGFQAILQVSPEDESLASAMQAEHARINICKALKKLF